MDLQAHISHELWNAIENPYESGSYTHAILEAMHFLSNTLREKSGADGDGFKLIGEAFGGDPPLIRLNRLQTESEKNQQKGMEHLLRGMYMAIRNPRSHEQFRDNKETADAIIFFLNHILNILGGSEEQFTFDRFLARVVEPGFVKTQAYATLIVGEIPKNKRFDTLIFLYKEKEALYGENFALVCQEILKLVTEDQKKQFMAVVSHELKDIQDDLKLRCSLQILTPDLWSELSEIARIRIENKIVASIKNGFALDGKITTGNGWLATWAKKFFKSFSPMSTVQWALVEKLGDDNYQSRHYVMRYFIDFLYETIDSYFMKKQFMDAISSQIIYGDSAMEEEFLNSHPNKAWRDEFRKVFDQNTDIIKFFNERDMIDDIPF